MSLSNIFSAGFVVLACFILPSKGLAQGAGQLAPARPNAFSFPSTRTNPRFGTVMRLPPDLLSIASVTVAPPMPQDPSCRTYEAAGLECPPPRGAYLYEVRVRNNGAEISSDKFLKIRVLNVDGLLDQEMWIPLIASLASGGEAYFRLGHYETENEIGSIRVDAVNGDGTPLSDLNTGNNIYTIPRVEMFGGGGEK